MEVHVAVPVAAALLLVPGLAAIWLARLFPDIRPRWPVFVLFVLVAPLLALAFLTPPVPLVPLLGACVFTLGLVAIAIVDFESRTIPDAFVIPLILAGLLWQFAFSDGWTLHLAWVGGLIVVAILAGFLSGNRPGPVGSGDVLLVAAAISWMGPDLMIDTFVLCAALLLIGVAFRTVRGLPAKEFALAPAFSASCLAVWFGLRLL